MPLSPIPSDAGEVAAEAREQWLELVAAAARDGTLVKLSLAAPRGGNPNLRRLRARPVNLRAGSRLQFVWEQSTQDITKNFDLSEALSQLAGLLGTPFGAASLTTTTRTAWLELREGKAPRLRFETATAAPADRSHDRVKDRKVDAGQNWLKALGVTTAEGAVCRGMEAKFRQIHRFVELLEPLLADAGILGGSDPSAEPVRFVDMGCGKGYLTFAAHEFLRGRAGRPVKTLGIEVRPELVEAGNRIARDTGCKGLEFQAGAIAETPLARADVLVALHACDTATDDALAAGIKAGASLLVVAPCCHQELRPRLDPPPALAPALRHGIFRERQAEFVTDALRAALLESAGYESRVFEFISPEHTAKNLMIAGVKQVGVLNREAAARKVRELAAFYGIKRQRLAERLEVPIG